MTLDTTLGQAEQEAPTAPRLVLVVFAALTFTLVNCLKPVHIDDTVYGIFAVHIAERPLDPYGFFFNDSLPANEMLAAPVVLYWLGLAVRCFGEQPALWKCWMFPFAFLFVYSLDCLLRRFARGVELPFLALTVFSPTFLPSFNLMLDVPALALGLSGLCLFLRAVDRGSIVDVVFAGLVTGLAMQTKYTAFVVPAAIVLYSILHRRLWLGVLAAGLACTIFVAWEAFVEWKYGESHFLHSLLANHQRNFLRAKSKLVLPLFGMMGGLMAPLFVVGLAALGVSRKRVLLTACVVAAGLLAVLVVPAESMGRGHHVSADKGLVKLEAAIFGGVGVAFWIVVGFVVGTLVRSREACDRRLDWFLAAWLLCEIGGYFALSPFPAARRLMGVVVVSTLLIARLAAQRSLATSQPTLLRGVALSGAVLGFGLFFVDTCDAIAQKRSVEDAVAWIRAADPDARIRYVGGWGFEHYARKAGLEHGFAPDRLRKESCWLVVDSTFSWFRDYVDDNRLPVEHVRDVTVDGGPRLTTIRCFYCGKTCVQRYDGHRATATIFRLHGGIQERGSCDALTTASGGRKPPER